AKGRGRGHHRLSSSAHHHFHRHVLFHPLSLRRDASHHPPGRPGDDAAHGRQRRRIPQRCRQRLYGADGGSAHHPPVPLPAHPLGIDDRDDQRHGPRFRRRHGRLHPVRRGGAPHAHRRHHDRPRHAGDRQNVRSGNGAACDRRPRGAPPHG